MPTTGTIQFIFDTGRAPETVAFVLDDSALRVLREYLAEALVLEEVMLSFGQHSIGFSMSARVGKPTAITPREPNAVQRAALLHHLRPFVLDEEPFSFLRTRTVVGQASDSVFLRERLKELKRMFGGQRLQEQMKVMSGDMLVNSEATLRMWLNAFEYHRDTEKAEALERSLGALPDSVTRPLFFMLLYQKSDAILHLGHIVSKLVNATSETGVL